MSALPLIAAPTEAELEFDRQVDALAQTGMAEHRDLADSCCLACSIMRGEISMPTTRAPRSDNSRAK